LVASVEKCLWYKEVARPRSHRERKMLTLKPPQRLPSRGASASSGWALARGRAMLRAPAAMGMGGGTRRNGQSQSQQGSHMTDKSRLAEDNVEWHADDYDYVHGAAEGSPTDGPVIDTTVEDGSGCGFGGQVPPVTSFTDAIEALGEERAALESERKATLEELRDAVQRGAKREVETAARFVKRVRALALELFMQPKE